MPTNSNLSFLKGLVEAELVQVCIGFNELILRFYPDGISITIMSVDRFWKANSKWQNYLTSGDGSRSPFGKTVIKFDQINDGKWSIHLSNGDSLLLEADETGFESIVFKIDGETYVV
ncbi:hypothetical protein IDJ81_13565 [Tsuneonella flava]|uniref:Uncharacterized protein n=1 Tax=Tsuneonella flava TaxID=2055955 RepID=A0ABX7K909_9SPHN|nr:hypothetical protein [Tsuneonella flava]QSB44328.1 hypothetical protein IDJ81_13565 [Tsuneonella flava]